MPLGEIHPSATTVTVGKPCYRAEHAFAHDGQARAYKPSAGSRIGGKAFGCKVDLRIERFQVYGRQAEEVRLTIVVRKESHRGEPLTHGSNIPADQPDIETLVKEIVRGAAARLAKA